MHHVPSTSQLCTTLCLVPENNTFLTPNFTFSMQSITFLPPHIQHLALIKTQVIQ